MQASSSASVFASKIQSTLVYSAPLPSFVFPTSSSALAAASSSSSSTTPLHSDLPDRKIAANTPPGRNDTVAIVTLMILVLLCLIIVLGLAYFIFQKWTGDCSNCKELQRKVDQYATGQMVPITKQTCQDRDSYFAEQEVKCQVAEGKLANIARHGGSNWTLSLNNPSKRDSVASKWTFDGNDAPAGPAPASAPVQDRRSVKSDFRMTLPPVAEQKPLSMEFGHKPDPRGSAASKDPRANRPRSAVSSMHGTPYNDPRWPVFPEDNSLYQNPYIMNGKPTGDPVRPPNGNQSTTDGEPTEKPLPPAPELSKANRHRSGAYGRMTPPPSPRVFADVDLEGQKEKKPGRMNIWK
jgi:hypothetical protein